MRKSFSMNALALSTVLAGGIADAACDQVQGQLIGCERVVTDNPRYVLKIVEADCRIVPNHIGGGTHANLIDPKVALIKDGERVRTINSHTFSDFGPKGEVASCERARNHLLNSLENEFRNIENLSIFKNFRLHGRPMEIQVLGVQSLDDGIGLHLQNGKETLLVTIPPNGTTKLLKIGKTSFELSLEGTGIFLKVKGSSDILGGKITFRNVSRLR